MNGEGYLQACGLLLDFGLCTVSHWPVELGSTGTAQLQPSHALVIQGFLVLLFIFFSSPITPASLMTSFACLSVFFFSLFLIGNSVAPSQDMSAWLGRLEFPLLMSLMCLSGPVHNSGFVYPKC